MTAGANPAYRPDGLKVRAFFGLPVPEALRQELGPYLAACAATAPDFRWVPAANLHLTVRFIGTVERTAIENIADRLAQRSLVEFELALGGVGAFRRGRMVRVVWLQVSSGVEAARELAVQVETECAAVGLTAEPRPFQPHLTLARARARDGAPLPPLPDPPQLDPWRADELVLYRSHLGRAGSVYEPLRTIKLS
ncbi:MAG TPA: RNA 2',3'-cyclic phosphodiesterase [Candidatus Dormibacteraeota bacterium]|nr:RNA 2',3'-cyclic phosphodiesterase [Candidatus Dormibacteraeota bacterium]